MWQELITLYVLYKNDTFMDNRSVSGVLSSNMMLRDIRVCALLIVFLYGFIDGSYSEPAFRRHRMLNYQLSSNNNNNHNNNHNSKSFDKANDSKVTVDCVGSRADSPECKLLVKSRNDTIRSNGTIDRLKDSNVEDSDQNQSWIAEVFGDGDDSALEEGRGRKKKKGKGGIFFMVAAAMKATLLWVMVHATALLAGKAFVIAKIALALAAAVALKKSLDHGEKTSYEIIKHPQHSYASSHSSSIDYDHHGGFEGHRRRR
ncbi:uncharacterized protein LOC123271892 isoform X1 [Cotesia glomerata]|uniref:Uncharacterized protein n=1 Tax=Cotesia glomerata TaxID=32391 RepID=A0AAV7IVN5_COTGL|nr:uncharacterized protein LOC123271892 isoform X1 [Cotesia glomerata]KAH0557707.1 hypothetical protein KQX54_010532 [Cotesia glomerata]